MPVSEGLFSRLFIISEKSSVICLEYKLGFHWVVTGARRGLCYSRLLFSPGDPPLCSGNPCFQCSTSPLACTPFIVSSTIFPNNICTSHLLEGRRKGREGSAAGGSQVWTWEPCCLDGGWPAPLPSPPLSAGCLIPLVSGSWHPWLLSPYVMLWGAHQSVSHWDPPLLGIEQCHPKFMLKS